MEKYLKVGNITVYTKYFKDDNSIEISFYNGADLVARETYFNATIEKAVDDLFSKVLDTHTEEFVHSIFLEKYSDNTFSTSDTDWFCRIDDTQYFKHICKSKNDFIRDKNGLRIIDR